MFSSHTTASGYDHSYRASAADDFVDLDDPSGGNDPSTTTLSDQAAGEMTDTGKDASKDTGKDTGKDASKESNVETRRMTPDKIQQYIDQHAIDKIDTIGSIYLLGRGIDVETMRELRLGYDEARDCVIIPYPGEDYYIARSMSLL